jgi:hypothetical protein
MTTLGARSFKWRGRRPALQATAPHRVRRVHEQTRRPRREREIHVAFDKLSTLSILTGKVFSRESFEGTAWVVLAPHPRGGLLPAQVGETLFETGQGRMEEVRLRSLGCPAGQNEIDIEQPAVPPAEATGDHKILFG